MHSLVAETFWRKLEKRLKNKLYIYNPECRCKLVRKKSFLILVQRLYIICACWMTVPCAVSAIFISGQSKLFCCSVIPYYSIPSDSIHVLTKTSTSSRQRANYLTHFKSLRWFRWVGLCKWGYCFPWKCFYQNISSNLEAGIKILLSFAIVL